MLKKVPTKMALPLIRLARLLKKRWTNDLVTDGIASWARALASTSLVRPTRHCTSTTVAKMQFFCLSAEELTTVKNCARHLWAVMIIIHMPARRAAILAIFSA